MKKIIVLILLFSFNLQASELLDHIKNNSPTIMDFGLFKISHKLLHEQDRHKRIFQGMHKKEFEFIAQQKFGINDEYFDFLDSFYYHPLDFDLLDVKFNDEKNSIQIYYSLTTTLYFRNREHEKFVAENINKLDPKKICKKIRTRILESLSVYELSPNKKISFFSEFFAPSGKEYTEESIQNENTNLIIVYNYGYPDKAPFFNATVCMGDLFVNEPFYKEYDHAIIINSKEHGELVN